MTSIGKSYLDSVSKWHSGQQVQREQDDTKRAAERARASELHAQSDFIKEFDSFKSLVDELQSSDGSPCDEDKNPGDVLVTTEGLVDRRMSMKMTENGLAVEVKTSLGQPVVDRYGSIQNRTLEETSYLTQDDGTILGISREYPSPDNKKKFREREFLLDTNSGMYISL